MRESASSELFLKKTGRGDFNALVVTREKGRKVWLGVSAVQGWVSLHKSRERKRSDTTFAFPHRRRQGIKEVSLLLRNIREYTKVGEAASGNYLGGYRAHFPTLS